MAEPWDDDTQDARALLDRARQLKEAEQFGAAAELFHRAYCLEPTPYAASQYVSCMRRQGVLQARQAVVFAQQPLDRWPQETWLVREYVWAIYDGYLKGGAEVEEEETADGSGAEFPVMVKAARRILKLSQEELPRLRTVFAICRQAKARRQWSTMLEFAQALDRDTLSDEVRLQHGRALPSDEQQWLYLMTRAHLELGNYEECLRLAREGMERYPFVMFFHWWHALARVRQGSVEAGLRELEEVERRYRAPWYVRRDIAEAYEKLGRDEEAWRWYCAAASAPGELRSRVSMLTQMGQLLERKQRWQAALDHLLLAWTLAARQEGWQKLAAKSREQVEAFIQRSDAQLDPPASLPDAPPAPEPLLAACRQAWTDARG